MAYHVFNLDTQEEVAESPFSTKAEAVGRVAWAADPPDAFIPSGYKVTKDGSSAQPCAFHTQANGFEVAECEECVREDKPDIDAVQTWLTNHLP